MIDFSAAEIAAITHGYLTATAAGGGDSTPSAVVTDSRQAAAGTLFVAKPGEVSDGHLFVPAAFAAGAVLALVEREVVDASNESYPAVVVPDVIHAMGLLAAETVRRIRDCGELTVIGITGSAGKTTTKDLLAGILSGQAPTVAPIGSYNGEVGVPLTVFGADYATRFLVIEMGATGIGHIEYLARMVRPDVGVVLGVGTAHSGEFGGVANIARAKSELVAALGPGGTAVLNADDPRVAAMAGTARDTGAELLFFSSRDERVQSSASRTGAEPDDTTATACLRAGDLVTGPQGHPEFILTLPDGGRFTVRSRLLGTHHVTNLLAAASAAYAVGIAGEVIAASLSAQGPASRWRMERTERADGVTVINDAYNANPESMRAALAALAELGLVRRTWAVLGEMLELGEDSILDHDAIGRRAVRLNISKLVVVGTGARAIHTGAVMEGSWGEESVWVPDVDAAYDLLQEELTAGDLVLFKSSNGAGLRFLGDRIASSAGQNNVGQNNAGQANAGHDGAKGGTKP